MKNRLVDNKAGQSALRSSVILFLLILIACEQTGTPTLVSAITPLPSHTPQPEVRITSLKPGENPWQIIAVDQSHELKLLTAHSTQPGWIYVVTGDGGLVVSRNAGDTWQAGPLSGIDLMRVAPTDPMVIYTIAERRTGLWKSNNGGRSFQRLSTPLKEHSALALAPSDADVIYLVGRSGKGELLGGRELYRSDDGGESWVFLAQLPAKMGYRGDLFVDPTNEAHLYATLSEQSISESKAFESRDAGVTWREVESLRHLTPMKWILTQGQTPTAYVVVSAEQVEGQVPPYVAARPKSVKLPLPEGKSVEVFPNERFPEFSEFMVLDALFTDPNIVVGRYLGGTYGGAILLTKDGGDTWLRLDTAGWGAGGALYPMALVRELALVGADPLRVLALVHWPPDLQGLWMLQLRTLYPSAVRTIWNGRSRG